MPWNDAMTSSKVFTSKGSETLQPSKAGTPQGKRWDDLFQSSPRAIEDLLADREPPPAEEREPL
jgi:hypothetical protein